MSGPYLVADSPRPRPKALRAGAVSASAPRRAVLTCALADLVPWAGAAALHGGTQVALFRVPGESPEVHAIGNFDPLGGANVLSRGIVGDRGGELVVASPLYKHHFSLTSGRCLENPEVGVPVYRVLISDGYVFLVG